VLIAAVFAVVVRGRSYAHYFQLLVFPVGLFGGVVAGALLGDLRGDWFKNAISLRLMRPMVLAIFLCCGIVPQIWWRAHEPQPFLGRFTATRGVLARWPVSNELLRHATPGERVGMWGWMPVFWVETGLLPATRDGETSRQIEPHPRREYYRARYLSDLRRTRPPVFVDAVGRWNFSFTNRETCGHETFPELRDYIAENYHLVRDVISTRVYVRNDRR
jgi:hypothetical protein